MTNETNWLSVLNPPQLQAVMVKMWEPTGKLPGPHDTILVGPGLAALYFFGLAFMWNALHPIVLPALLLAATAITAVLIGVLVASPRTLRPSYAYAEGDFATATVRAQETVTLVMKKQGFQGEKLMDEINKSLNI